ncbi:Flavin-containing monooxygenase [Forsythia ovata]|uniref:Flavin-containing monooxygenase n=1 Tax=Forsythia ovata TaxID=205694 RepID=A0ABD1TPB5_9LAMI
MAKSLKVAVIGDGVTGLASTHELGKEGHHVVIYKKSDQLGETSVYDPRVESDLLGVDPKRKIKSRRNGVLYYVLVCVKSYVVTEQEGLDPLTYQVPPDHPCIRIQKPAKIDICSIGHPRNEEDEVRSSSVNCSRGSSILGQHYWPFIQMFYECYNILIYLETFERA